MLDNDIPGLDESRLRGAGTRDAGPARAGAVESSREAAAPSGESRGNQETGLQNPDQISSREKASTCVGRILTGVKELRRNSGLGEAATAEPVGRTAIDLSDKPGTVFPI